MSCEKCWGDGYARSRYNGKDQVENYHDLLKEREDENGFPSCTPEEQAGDWWDEKEQYDSRFLKYRKKTVSHILKKSDLHHYENKVIEFAKENPKCALFLDMGLGKTVSALTVVSDFLDDFFITKVLIIAPLRVCNTVWKQEAEKWEHLKHLKISVCTGSFKDRKNALSSNSDIFIINRENVNQLVKSHENNWLWDMLIIDESSSFKNFKSQRFKALRKITKYLDSIILLSGTPSPQGLMDLWTQFYLIDNGKRLGRTISNYRSRFFESDYMGYTYTPLPDSENRIKKLIKDISISMDSKDYLELPEKIFINEYIEMPEKLKKQYKELEKEFLLSLEAGNIEALSQATLSNKLLQMCNGAIYDSDKNTHLIHDLKLQTLKDIIDDNPNENFLIAYNFKSDLERIKKLFPQAIQLDKEGSQVEQWNKGKIKILITHPLSGGHGLNLQRGGSVVIWFGLNWSLELYQQFNARLHRQGQEKPVRIIHIIMKDGIDEKVLEAIKNKAKTQKDLLDYLKLNL